MVLRGFAAKWRLIDGGEARQARRFSRNIIERFWLHRGRSETPGNGEVDLMNVKRLGALFVAALLVMATVPTFAASDATVGEFVIKLAKSRNLAATDARVAGDALRGIGVRVPPDLNYSARLTEGDVTRLARSFGLNVTTTTPDSSFSSAQVDTFFATFGTDINSKLTSNDNQMRDDDDGDGPPFNPYSKGKGGANGKKKGHDFTPAEPE